MIRLILSLKIVESQKFSDLKLNTNKVNATLMKEKIEDSSAEVEDEAERLEDLQALRVELAKQFTPEHTNRVCNFLGVFRRGVPLKEIEDALVSN